MIKIAHLSDLHFSHFSMSLSQFFSKRWLGNFNLFFNRGKKYTNALPFSLPFIFKEKKISHVIISGDLTTTANKKEYQIAQQFVTSLKELGIKVFVIPGNHDHYTKYASKRKIFYRYFPSPKGSPFSLSLHGVTSVFLTHRWHLVLMDTTYASSLFSSSGLFSQTVEENLKMLLSQINPQDNIILVNHFPFFQNDCPRRRLIRGKELEKVIQMHPNIQLYLHGHTHKQIIADLRASHLPLILDCGSASYKNGSWNELLLDQTKLDLRVHQWNGGWKLIDRHSFIFEPKLWYEKGLRFKCTQCGKCCTKKGYVWLEQEDIKRLSFHFNLTEKDFIQKYTRQCGHDFALLDNPQSDDCIFLKDKKVCSVYEARPIQCQTFPWWPQNLTNPQDWERLKEECEGVDEKSAPLISLPEINKYLEK